MLKIIKNSNEEEFKEILADVKANDGYCPCLNYKNEDTKCMCKQFRDKDTVGKCHCGLYLKVEI